MKTRTITYDGVNYDDPGEAFSDADLLASLVMTHPELKGGKVVREENDGEIHITFEAPPKRLGAEISPLSQTDGGWLDGLLAALVAAPEVESAPVLHEVPQGVVTMKELYRMAGAYQVYKQDRDGVPSAIKVMIRGLLKAHGKPVGVALL